MRNVRFVLFALAGLCVSGMVFAQTFSTSQTVNQFCQAFPGTCCNNCALAPPITISLTGIPTNPTGNGVLTITAAGDIDDPVDEAWNVKLDALDLGNALGDPPSDCTTTSQSVVIPLASLQTIVQNGAVNVTFTPNQANNDIEDDGCPPDFNEFVTARLEFPVAATASPGIPTLSTWGVVLLALLLVASAVWGLRRR